MDLHLDADDLNAHRPPPGRGRSGAGIKGWLRKLHYSRFVGLMKISLSAIAAALLGLMVVWPKLAPRDNAFKLAFADFNMKTVDTLSMQKPRYFGTDNNNLPFSITAQVATQTDPKDLTVSLENPVADFQQKSGSTVLVSADVGYFRQKDNTLDLLGHVDLYQDTGYEMHTNSARLDVKRGDASGDEAARVQGPAGTIEGEGFRLRERGRDIIFTGKAKALLISAADKKKPAHKKQTQKKAKP